MSADLGDSPPEPSDPRVAAYYRLLNAIDSGDPRGGIAASRELRRLGLSVMLIKPSHARGE